MAIGSRDAISRLTMRRRKGMAPGKKKGGAAGEPLDAKIAHVPPAEVPQTEPGPAAVAPAAPAEHPVSAERSGSPDPARMPSPEQARHIAEIEIALGQIVSLLMRSAHHRQHSLADLEWMLWPALLAGQFRIAHAQAQPNGPRTPVAAALWASVSNDVDQRLSDLANPLRLSPQEWRSGEILWLVDTVGDARVVPQLLKHLQDTAFKRRDMKVRVLGEDGKTGVGVLRGAGETVSGSS
jgi:cytolysin-activating lysine-acyltransferase